MKCEELGLSTSKANSFFRDDYEHCLMPCYAYDPEQPENIKLQTLSADAYPAEIVYDLSNQWDYAISFVEIINDVEIFSKPDLSAEAYR